MKTLHLLIIVILVVMGLSSNAAFASSVITVNDTQYEIVFDTVNSTVGSILPHLNSYAVNSLNMNIIGDKQYNGSVTLTLTKDAMANIFCIPKFDVDNYLKNNNSIFVLIDSIREEHLRTSSTDNNVSLTFDVQAGSKNAIITNGFVGMAVEPLVNFKGIPEVNIYRPDQQVIFNGTLVDACNRHLGEEKIYYTIEQLNVTKQVMSDTKGKFSINFTIPENTGSGHYKSKIEMYSKDISGAKTIYLIVEKKGESNIPFLFKTNFGSFEIPYHFDHGEVIDVNQDFIENSLSIEYYATQNGTMEILFPKTLMDLVSGNIGSTTVTSGSLHLARFQEQLDSQNHRIFNIPVFEGKNFINIWIPKEGVNAVYDNAGLQALVVSDKFYPVPYNITGGIIQNFYADPFYKRITVDTIGANGGGHLHLELPRKMLDSIQNGKDARFLVTDTLIVNGLQGDTKPAHYTESPTNTDTRTLEIDFPQGRSFIEIKGTQIVPEFPVAIPILLVGTVLAIAFYRIKFRK
jgi:hypothetical protein